MTLALLGLLACAFFAGVVTTVGALYVADVVIRRRHGLTPADVERLTGGAL